jgi:hypothetical protein
MNASVQIETGARSFRIVAGQNALRRRQAGSRQSLHTPLDGLLPAILDKAFKGEL